MQEKMEPYFEFCYTLDELQDKYRTICKRLHPDKGGNKEDFQHMQEEYEAAKRSIEYREAHDCLPDLFSKSANYEYLRRPVRYSGKVGGHYYKFTQDYGANILIDKNHTNLIFTKHKALA